MKNNSALFVTLFFFTPLLAANTTQAASVTIMPNAKVCTASYTSIGNIVIAESGAQSDFGIVGTATTSNRLFINAPEGFLFNPAAAVNANAAGGGNVSAGSVLFISASTIAISYNVDNNTVLKNDVLTISGMQVKAATVSTSLVSARIGSGSTPIVGLPAGSTVANFQSAITVIAFSPPIKYIDDASFSLNGSGSHNLSAGVSLNSTSFSGTGVTGSNFNPATAGAGVHTLTYTINTIGPTCAFATTATIDVNLRPADDADNDGVTAAVETQLGTNPLVTTNFATLGLDSDNDGISNATEIALGSNPDLADTDTDGLNDGLELIQYVTNPLTNDTDGDGTFDNVDIEPGTGACTMPLNGIYKGTLLSVGN